jgi:hypothetical protein
MELSFLGNDRLIVRTKSILNEDTITEQLIISRLFLIAIASQTALVKCSQSR